MTRASAVTSAEPRFSASSLTAVARYMRRFDRRRLSTSLDARHGSSGSLEDPEALLCELREPTFVCREHVVGHLPYLVQGTNCGGQRVEGHCLVDGLPVSLEVSLDDELLHGDVAPVQGGQLWGEGPHHARVNSPLSTRHGTSTHTPSGRLVMRSSLGTLPLMRRSAPVCSA